jgi:hypothetical protein
MTIVEIPDGSTLKLAGVYPKRFDADFKDIVRAELEIRFTDSSDLFEQFSRAVKDICSVVTKFDSRLLSTEQRLQVLQVVSILSK